MKTTLLILLSFFLLLACNRREKELTLKNQQLNHTINQMDSTIKELTLSMDEIETNLGIISTSDDIHSDVRKRLQRDISHIKSLVQRNKNQYDSLRSIILGTSLKAYLEK